MPHTYTVSADNITLVGASTLVFINPKSAGSSLEILRVWASQADTTSRQQRVQLVTQATAFPTLTSTTPAKHRMADPISEIVGGTAGAAGTCGINASAEGAGTKTVILSDQFNVLNGFLWLPTPEERIVVNAIVAQGFGLYFPAAPTVLTGWSCGVTYREL